MPHAELRYSNDLGIDPHALLQEIEAVLQRHDPGSGDCKGRAYPAEVFHHSHLWAGVSLLAKPHRDAQFILALQTELEQVLKAGIPKSCYFTLDISFSSQIYLTNRHEVPG